MKPVIRVKSEQERVELVYALAKHRLAARGGAPPERHQPPLEQEMRTIAQWICVESPKTSVLGNVRSANDARV
jgi:hypothetical protein